MESVGQQTDYFREPLEQASLYMLSQTQKRCRQSRPIQNLQVLWKGQERRRSTSALTSREQWLQRKRISRMSRGQLGHVSIIKLCSYNLQTLPYCLLRSPLSKYRLLKFYCIQNNRVGIRSILLCDKHERHEINNN